MGSLAPYTAGKDLLKSVDFDGGRKITAVHDVIIAIRSPHGEKPTSAMY